MVPNLACSAIFRQNRRPGAFAAPLVVLTSLLVTTCAAGADQLTGILSLRSATLAVPAGCTPEATSGGRLRCDWLEPDQHLLSLTLDEGPVERWLSGPVPADPNALTATAFEGFRTLLDAQPGFLKNINGHLKPEALPQGAASCLLQNNVYRLPLEPQQPGATQFPQQPRAMLGHPPGANHESWGVFCLSTAPDPA
jgi:hypothetical protein